MSTESAPEIKWAREAARKFAADSPARFDVIHKAQAEYPALLYEFVNELAKTLLEARAVEAERCAKHRCKGCAAGLGFVTLNDLNWNPYQAHSDHTDCAAEFELARAAELRRMAQKFGRGNDTL